MTRWFLAGVATSTAIGWVAATCHLGGGAPIGILSLGVGVALGAALCGIAAAQRAAGGSSPSSLRLLVATLLLAILTVLAEHTWLYRDFRRQWLEARDADPHVALFRAESPWTPGEYFARELSPSRAALWCLDAALITAGAVGTVLITQRKHA